MRIIKNSAVYTFGYILSRLQNFLFLPILTRSLGPTNLGVLEATTALAFFIMVAIVFNLDASISSHFNELKDKDEQKELFWTAAAGSAICGIITFTLALLFKNQILGILELQDTEGAFWIYFVALLATAISAWNHLFTVLLRIRFFSKQYALILVVNTSLNLALSWILVYHYKNALSILVGGLIANLLTFLITLYLSKDIFPIKINFPKWLGTFAKISLPLLPYAIFSWTISLADRTILANFSGLSEVGYYSVLVKIAALSSAIMGPFQIAWMPFAMKSWTNNRESSFPVIYGWLCLTMALFLIVLGVLSKPLVLILAGENYSRITSFIVPMAFCNVLNILFYFPLVSFMRTKKTYASSLSFAVGALANLAINYALIPRHGLVGAVIANLVSYLIMFITSALLETKQTSLGYPYIRSIFTFAVSLGLYFANDAVFSVNGWGLGLLSTFISVGFVFILAQSIGLARMRSLKNLIKTLNQE